MESINKNIVNSLQNKNEPFGFIMNCIDYVYRKYVDVYNRKDSDVFVFGGFVRDVIRNRKFTDIDIFIKQENIIKDVVDMLEVTGRLIEKNKKMNYGKREIVSIVVESPNGTKFNVDLVNFNIECDFLCNNLMITSRGNIRARTLNTKSELEDMLLVLQCLSDISTGTLTHVNEDSLKKLDTCERIQRIKRYQKMISYGFQKNKTIEDLYIVDSLEEKCSICLSECSKDENVLFRTKCNHVFHIDCIEECFTNKIYKCPNCRKKL